MKIKRGQIKQLKIRLNDKILCLFAGFLCAGICILYKTALNATKPKTSQKNLELSSSPFQKLPTLNVPEESGILLPHHKLFAAYGQWSGNVPKGCDDGHESLFLGVLTACSMQLAWKAGGCSGKNIAEARYPPLSDHTFEWFDIIHALEYAAVNRGSFNMLELGAGWAKWAVDGMALAKRRGFSPGSFHAVGVEAQDQHCAWAHEHIERNDFKNDITLLCAAVSHEDGFVEFPSAEVNDQGSRYGLGVQYLLDGKKTSSGSKKVKAYGICTLLNLPEFNDQQIDLLSLDVQSYEHAILKPTPETLECLRRKVAVIHISLHRVEENDARGLANTFIGLLGWDLVRYFPLYSNCDTQFGKMEFTDGVITFVNPALAPGLAKEIFHTKNIHIGKYTGYKGKKMHETVTPDWGKGDYITDIQKPA